MSTTASAVLITATVVIGVAGGPYPDWFTIVIFGTPIVGVAGLLSDRLRAFSFGLILGPIIGGVCLILIFMVWDLIGG